MNKFWESRLFLIIISLALSIALYVTATTDVTNNLRTISTFLPPATQEETIDNVPVVVNYDSERYVVTGVPETVSVTLSGPSSLIRLAKNRNAFQVVANLEGISPGTYAVPLQVTDLEGGLTATVNPEEIEITIQERAAGELPVSLVIEGTDFLRQRGFVVTDQALSIDTAQVAGPSEAVGQIVKLQATVNVAERQDNFEEEVTIVAMDRSGSQVEGVTITPNTANATITIVEVGEETARKQVPVRLITIGTAPANIFIGKTTVTPEQVTIYGPETVLSEITEVTASIDLTNITENTTERVALVLPENVTAASPSTVTVSIQLEEVETRTISNVPISIRNLAENLEVSPEELEPVAVTVRGVPSVLNELNSENIVLFVDLSGLGAGSHDVSIQGEAVANATISIEGTQTVSINLEEVTDDENGADTPTATE